MDLIIVSKKELLIGTYNGYFLRYTDNRKFSKSNIGYQTDCCVNLR